MSLRQPEPGGIFRGATMSEILRVPDTESCWWR